MAENTHPNTDTAANGAGARTSPGSEPYDAVAALTEHFDREERGTRRARGRADAADPSDEDRRTPASHEAGDPADEYEDEGAGPDDDPDDLADQRDDDAPPDPDDADDDDDPTVLQRKVRVKVQGEDQVVTVDELRRGYQRHQDYTQKTTELAAQRHQLATVHAEVLQRVQAMDQGLEQFAAMMQAQAPANLTPEQWEQLYQTNPLEFVRQRAAVDKFKQDMERINQARQANGLAAQQAQSAQMREILTAEAGKLFAARPDWADPMKGSAAKQALADYARAEYGYDPSELAGVIDHRMLLILDKARMFDEALARVRTRSNRQQRPSADDSRPRAPRPATPGAARAPVNRQRDNALQAQKRLAKTGRVDDAQAAIEALL